MTDIRYAAYTYTGATQNADGTWTPPAVTGSSEGDWGSLRIEVGATWDCHGSAWAAAGSVAVKTADGVDITQISGVPTLVESLSWAEPYGESTGSLALPRLTPWDYPAAVGLDIDAGVNVDIYRVLPTALAAAVGTAEVPYWHGIVASLELADGPGISNGLSLQLVGALYGECSVRAHQPFMLDEANDIGTWVGRSLSPKSYARPLPPYERFSFESDTTGIEVRYRGSRGQTVIDYLDELLALSQPSDSTGEWTIRRAYQTIGSGASAFSAPRARHYYLAQKAVSINDGIQQSYATVGGYGVSYSLSYDATETPNAIYGEGVHPVSNSADDPLSGSRWRNARYPMLTTTPPAYPSRTAGTTYPIQSGDNDANFTADVVTQVQSQLRAGGWPDVRITGTWDADTSTAINALWQSLGSAQDSQIASNGDWDLVFNVSTGTTDLGSGFFLPLYDANPYYDYAADGDVIGTASSYKPWRLRVEESISYGDGITKARATRNARRIATSGYPEYLGTVTLTSDPVDENGTARSRLDIREGSWLRMNGLPDVTDYCISGVTVQPESDGVPVTLTVSSKPRDLLALTTKIERNKAAKSDPARSFYNMRTKTVRPFRSAVGWDAESGAGLIRSFSAAGSAWEVVRFVGAQYGQVGSLRIDVEPAAGYCFAIFGGSVAGTALDALIPNPLAAVGTADGSYPSWWQHPDNQASLTSWGFVEAWGDSDEHAGYYPGAYSIGTAVAAGTATGALEDAGSWSFASLDPPFLYAAIWPNTSGTVSVSGQLRIIVDEG